MDQQIKQQPTKPLRFVTNYGAPHPKRRRIGAACLTCRKRKTACSGERPFCDTCKQNKLECAGYSAETAANALQKHAIMHADPSQSPQRNERPRARQGAPALLYVQNANPNARLPSDSIAVSTNAHTAKASTSPMAGHSLPEPDLHEQAVAAPHPLPESLFSRPRDRMPYFRWLGPTAIMPGFKQMVVKVKHHDSDHASSSAEGGPVITSPLRDTSRMDQRFPSLTTSAPSAVENDARTQLSLPFYDSTSLPPSELITHLAQTFFTHLGCNYPFLQRRTFLRDLEDKRVDTILVDAVCALAARFSTHPLLLQHQQQQKKDDHTSIPADNGHVFAQRAKTALVDTFPCPTVAAVQAALLLAYNEFGESRDSGLWVYLGIAIRLAQDLGMHKLEGLRYKGMNGPTPRAVKWQSTTRLTPTRGADSHSASLRPPVDLGVAEISSKKIDVAESHGDVHEQKAAEQERIDTFWAVFFLDRVVSSGTGRRSTLRDKDIELSFPALDDPDARSAGWPPPFPALIRIVHLYGRVADLLNGMKEPGDITTDTPQRLAATESQVTTFYQGLSTKLHFDAVNFQHYVQAGEGTNFVLLHCWFHALIVLLHQPTLLKTFEGRMLQLFPNSQQLSMSSAKTIADILNYSQLIDAKAALGNPFTTQPIYIAACAFLRETAEQTATSNVQSGSSTPKTSGSDGEGKALLPQDGKTHQTAPITPASNRQFPTQKVVSGALAHKLRTNTNVDKKTLAKHTLLATAASQHYQLCYKALQSLERYWAGSKYILTVLDQKFEGVGDPLLYTAEEGASALERPKPDPAFTSPGWRKSLGSGSSNPGLGIDAAALTKDDWQDGSAVQHGGPNPEAGKEAIGWTLTGNMNSPSTSLARHYANIEGTTNRSHTASSLPPTSDLESSSTHADAGHVSIGQAYHARANSSTSRQASTPIQRPHMPPQPASSSAVSDASLLLGLGGPYGHSNASITNLPYNPQHLPDSQLQPSQRLQFSNVNNFPTFGGGLPVTYSGNMQDFGSMLIESQDVDMSLLGLDMMPWFDSAYAAPTGEVINAFDPSVQDNAGHVQPGAPTNHPHGQLYPSGHHTRRE